MNRRRGQWFVAWLLTMVLFMVAGCTGNPPAETGDTEESEPAVSSEEEITPTESASGESETNVGEETVADTEGSSAPVTFVIAADSDLQPGLDIHDAASFMTGQSLGVNVFDTLIQLGPDGYEPRLATSWEASEDGWVFHLRDDVVFHDGTPFNAEAVKYNVDRLLSEELRQSSKWESVESAEVVDEFTIKFNTGGTPSAALLGQLVHAAGGAIQSPAALEEDEFPVGTGPFTFVEWNQDEELVLEKNEEYWMEGPFIERVEIKVVPEAATRVLMLESGEADFALYIPPADAQRLMEEKENIIIENARSAGWRYIGLNVMREPLDNKLVRQALNYAVDTDAIANDILLGFARPLTSPYGSGMFGHADVGDYSYDPERARELLAEAGYPDGFDLTLLTNDGRPREALSVAQAVQAYLGQVGVNVEIEVVEWGVLLDTIYTPFEDNIVEMHQSSFGGADPDTLRVLLACDQFPPQRNSNFYCNERVDELFEQGQFETDQEARVEIYREVQEIIWDDAPWIFINELLWLGGWHDGIQDLVLYEPNQTYYDLRWVTKE